MKPVPQQGGRTSRRAHAPDSGDKCVVGSSEDDGSDREGELDSEAQARSLVTGAPLPGKAPPPAKPCFRRLLSNRLIGAGVAAMSLCAFSSLSVFVTLRCVEPGLGARPRAARGRGPAPAPSALTQCFILAAWRALTWSRCRWA